jgi:predicted O-methyltransferase YrrM
LDAPPVYRRLYETAAICGGGTIIEIGTFCGAATIALALGAKSSNHSFASLLRMCRRRVGIQGPTINRRQALCDCTFELFDVSGAIEFVHGSAETIVAEKDPTEINLLLLDAGGRIEDDLALLHRRLARSCSIIIDDIDGRIFVGRNGRNAVVDQKHRISKLLADRFVSAGL